MAPPREWQLQTAKARFREVFGRARSEGPQRITRRGKEAVVVLSTKQYGRLVHRRVGAHNLAEPRGLRAAAFSANGLSDKA